MPRTAAAAAIYSWFTGRRPYFGHLQSVPGGDIFFWIRFADEQCLEMELGHGVQAAAATWISDLVGASATSALNVPLCAAQGSVVPAARVRPGHSRMAQVPS